MLESLKEKFESLALTFALSDDPIDQGKAEGFRLSAMLLGEAIDEEEDARND